MDRLEVCGLAAAASHRNRKKEQRLREKKPQLPPPYLPGFETRAFVRIPLAVLPVYRSTSLVVFLHGSFVSWLPRTNAYIASVAIREDKVLTNSIPVMGSIIAL